MKIKMLYHVRYRHEPYLLYSCYEFCTWKRVIIKYFWKVVLWSMIFWKFLCSMWNVHESFWYSFVGSNVIFAKLGITFYFFLLCSVMTLWQMGNNSGYDPPTGKNNRYCHSTNKNSWYNSTMNNNNGIRPQL